MGLKILSIMDFPVELPRDMMTLNLFINRWRWNEDNAVDSIRHNDLLREEQTPGGGRGCDRQRNAQEMPSILKDFCQIPQEL